MDIRRPGATGEPISRRDLLTGGAALVAASAVPQALARPSRDAICYASVADVAARIARGELSSEEFVTACIDRIEAVNPALNAVVQSTADAALARARQADAARARGVSWGPLHGVPMTIKDSFDTAGVVSTGGTLGRARFVPPRDATVVARLRGAGAILLGKTNTPELTLSFETDNLVYGRTANPYALDRSPGGSSGGAAALRRAPDRRADRRRSGAGGRGPRGGQARGVGRRRLPAAACVSVAISEA
ncbi:MAG TPA: amidase [Gammaproteobacteria bacterium]